MSCLLFVAALLTSTAAHATDHSAPMLEPEGLWAGDTLAMPGPPAGCKATIMVEQGRELCQDPRLADLVDDARMAAIAENAGDPSKLPTWYRSTASPDDGIGCLLSCNPLTGLARWIVRVEAPGYRGAVRCSVGEVAALDLQLGELGAEIPVGAGAMWLTDLDHFAVNMAFPEDGLYSPKELTGDNLCPGGQPTREGGVEGAFSVAD